MKVLAHRRSGASMAALFLLTMISSVSSFSPIMTKISPRIGTDIATCRRLDDDEPSKRHGRRNIACFEPLPQQKKDDAIAIFVAASIMVSTLVGVPLPAFSATRDGAITTATNNNDIDVQGIAAVTKSELGQTVRRSVIGSAQLADNIDLKWERFSDSLRDEKKCDPRTNRRMFDNGTRKDGTKIGNPVLGALCTPEPLKALNVQFAASITDLAQQAMKETTSDFRNDDLQEKESQIKEKVGAAFDRAVKNTASASSEDDETSFEESKKRLEFNRDLYIRMRAYGELVQSTNTINNNRETARAVEKLWGHKLLASLAPNANRHDYVSPFPKPDPTDDQPYDEGALLDALGAVSVALNKLQEGGLIGHWEISIPEDDYWNVVTIAVDDDVSIGGQILSRESNQPLRGSAVVAMVRSAMEEMAKINYKIDTFFIDPTTTRQELYNPTQLLVSLSDLGQ